MGLWASHPFQFKPLFWRPECVAWSWEWLFKVTAQGSGGTGGLRGGELSGRAASPSPRLAEASPAVRVGARVRGRRLAPHSGDPRVARVSPLPFALRALPLPPSPADKPPVPPNQVRLLLHACAAELDQLPLMACRPVPLPGSGRGGGEAKTRTMSGKGALLPQCRPFHSF